MGSGERAGPPVLILLRFLLVAITRVELNDRVGAAQVRVMRQALITTKWQPKQAQAGWMIED